MNFVNEPLFFASVIVRTPELRSSVGVRGLSAQAVDGLPSKDNKL